MEEHIMDFFAEKLNIDTDDIAALIMLGVALVFAFAR